MTEKAHKNLAKKRVGMSSPSLSLVPLEKAFVHVYEAGFRLWEIVAEGEHLLLDKRKQIENLLASYDMEITIHAPLSDVNIASPNPPMRDAAFDFIWRTMDIAHDLGVKVFTIHPGHISPLGFFAPEKIRKLSVAAVKKIDRISRGYDMTICLENMPCMATTICHTPEEIEEHLDGTDLMFCLDTGHANTCGNLREFIRLRDRIGNVHFHDNDGKKDQHLPPGEGTLDMDVVREMLANYTGNIIVESRNIEEGKKGAEYVEKLFKTS